VWNQKDNLHFGRPYRYSVSRASAGAVRCKALPLYILLSPLLSSFLILDSHISGVGIRLGVIGIYPANNCI
jgi:hypothetical protein